MKKFSKQRLLAYTMIFLGALIMILPFYIMFVYSTHTRTNIMSAPPPLLFGNNLVENFRELTDRLPFFRQLWNSFYIAVISTVLVLFFSSIGGYAFAMYEFKGKKGMFTFVLATMMIPPFLGIIPFWIMINWVCFDKIPVLGPMLIQTFGEQCMAGNGIALWLPGAANAFGIFMMRQYIGSAVPKELVEAARIDGCSEFRIYWNIVLPLIGPALGTLGLVAFIGQWNNVIAAIVVFATSTSEFYTGPLGVRSLMGFSGNIEWGAVMLGTALLVLPLLIMFIFAARRLIEGLTQGALKG